MSIKPILFNTEMVRAILDWRKDATRRIVKGFIPDDAVWGYTAFTPKGYISCRGTFADGYGEKFFKLPCEPGDILYVRETWKKAPNGYYYYEDWQRNDIADVVDEAKHLHRNIMTNWSSRPLKLMTMDEVEGRFFVRVKGTTVEQVEAVFDNVQIVNLKNLPGEFGFITECMKQGTYEEKVHKLNGNVITMIRVKD